MTKRAKAKQCPQSGKWLKNGASAKSGLNKTMLNAGLGLFEVFLRYKMEKRAKPLFKISPYQTSQECAVCDYTHPNNRKNQSDFHCQSCGHKANADHNSGQVIKKRAINMLLHSGAELVGTHENVLRLRTDDACKSKGNRNKTPVENSAGANDCLSKKKANVSLSEARVL
jgi:putative transposase